MNSDPEQVRRLGNVLRDLRRQRLYDPDGESFRQLCELSDCVEDLLALSSTPNQETGNREHDLTCRAHGLA